MIFSKGSILSLACICSNWGLSNRFVVAVMDKRRQNPPISHLNSIMFICFFNTANSLTTFLSHCNATEWTVLANTLSKRAEVKISFWQGSLRTLFWLFYSCSYTGWTCSYRDESKRFSFLPCWKRQARGLMLPFCRLRQSALILLQCSDVSTEVRCQTYLPCKLS